MRALVILAVGGLVLAAPIAAPLATDAQPHVHIDGFAFGPTPLAMRLGETVTWDNHDLMTHSVVSDEPLFASALLDNGEQFSYAPEVAATVPYHCGRHQFMHGELQVFDPVTLPDLAIAGIDVVDEVPGVSQTIEVTVRNLGQSLAEASVAKLWYELDGALHLIGEISVPELDADADHAGELVWDTLGFVGDFRLDAVADVDDAVFEGFEENNAASTQTTVLLEGFPGRDLLAELGL